MDGFSDFIIDDIESGPSADEDILDWMGKYLGSQDTKDIDEIIDHSDVRKQADTYDQFLGAKVVMLDSAGRTSMVRIMKLCMVNNENGVDVVTPNSLTNISMYEVESPDGMSRNYNTTS